VPAVSPVGILGNSLYPLPRVATDLVVAVGQRLEDPQKCRSIEGASVIKTPEARRHQAICVPAGPAAKRCERQGCRQATWPSQRRERRALIGDPQGANAESAAKVEDPAKKCGPHVQVLMRVYVVEGNACVTCPGQLRFELDEHLFRNPGTQCELRNELLPGTRQLPVLTE